MALPRLGTNPVLLFRLSLTFTVIESSRPTDWMSRPFSALPSSDHNELKLRGDLQLSCLCEFILARIMDQTTPSYGIGTKLTIYRHLAPEPTAPGYQHCRPADFEEEAQTTFTERYLKHPPLQGTTLWSQPFSITITDEITPNSTSGARLLGVNNKLVAKIYDPLYYSIPTLSNEVGTNPFRLADSDYTHETAAYERTNYRLGGTILPEYHGSFTCKRLGYHDTIGPPHPPWTDSRHLYAGSRPPSDVYSTASAEGPHGEDSWRGLPIIFTWSLAWGPAPSERHAMRFRPWWHELTSSTHRPRLLLLERWQFGWRRSGRRHSPASLTCAQLGCAASCAYKLRGVRMDRLGLAGMAWRTVVWFKSIRSNNRCLEEALAGLLLQTGNPVS